MLTSLVDDFTENEMWTPYYGNLARDAYFGKPLYPPQKGHMVSSFTGLCKLSVILGRVMLEIYGPGPEGLVPGDEVGSGLRSPRNLSFIKISSSIHTWWVEMPEAIRLDVNNLPTLSPPLHIVSLNLLYHTTLILLHRPFIIGATNFRSAAVSRSYQICISAAAAVHDLLQLITTTFGYDHTTYLNCYGTYIAATIAVLHFQLNDGTTWLPETGIQEDKLELKFYLGVLQRSATAMPGLNKSVSIMKRHVQTILDHRTKQYFESLFPGEKEIVDSSALSTDKAPPYLTSLYASSQPQTNVHQTAQPEQTGPFSDYPSINVEGLPAFPGQHFHVGNDFNVDQQINDPEMRAALLGLDPHVILQHDSSDWTSGAFYSVE